MRKSRQFIALFMIFVVALVSFIPALAAPLAQDPPPEPLPCAGTSVSGKVVAVNAVTGTVTVELSDGTLCTVNINVDESHPIVLLLGRYFGDISASTFEEALRDTQGCALFDGSAWTWVPCDAEGAEPVRITAYDPNTNTYTAVKEDGTVVTFSIEDPEVSARVQGALETLAIEWALEGDGDLAQVSDQIAAYHDDGMGFGVLVKLYAIAQEQADNCQTASTEDSALCPAVEELVALFKSGVGMGQIFKDYGKPDKLGVGHVRQELNQDKVTEKDKNKDKDKTNNGKGKPGDDQAGDSQTLPPAANMKDKAPKANNGLKGNCNAIIKSGKPKPGVVCP